MKRRISRSTIVVTLMLVAVVHAIGSSAAASSPTVTLVGIPYQPGSPTIPVQMDIAQRIDNDARIKDQNYRLEVTLQYVGTNNTVVSLDSGQVSIKDSTILKGASKGKALIEYDFNCVTLAVDCPGANPSYLWTGQIFSP